MAANDIHDVVLRLKAEARMTKVASDSMGTAPSLEKAGELVSYLRTLAASDETEPVVNGSLLDKLAAYAEPAKQEDRVTATLLQRLRSLDVSTVPEPEEYYEEKMASALTDAEMPREPSLQDMLLGIATEEENT
jgi:hypothetical protein